MGSLGKFPQGEENRDFQLKLRLLRRRTQRFKDRFSGSADKGDSSENQELLFYLFKFWDIFRQRFLILILLSSIVGLIVYKVRSSVPKKYYSVALIEVAVKAPQVFTNIRDVITHYVQVRRFYSTQRAILMSRTIAQKALQKLSWVLEQPDFYGIDKNTDKNWKEKVEKLKPIAPDILKSRISVQIIEKSSIYVVRVVDTDPKRAKELVEAVIEAYREFNRSFRLRATLNAYNEIRKQRNNFEKNLAKIQARLVQFRQRYNILTTSLDDRRNLAFKRLEALNRRYIKVTLERISLESQLRPFLKEGVSPEKLESFPPVLSNDLYWKLREKYSELQLQRESLLARYKVLHPKVQRLNRQLKRLKEIIQGQVLLVFNSYKERLEEVKREERILRRMVREAKSQFRRLERLNLLYDQIRQKEKALRRSLDILNRRYFELQLLKDSTVTNMRVVEPPKISNEPFYPRVKRDTFVGFSITFMVLFLFFYLIEVLDRSIKRPEDIEKAQVTFLGEVPLLPKLKNKKERDYELYDPNNPKGPLAESFRNIRTNLLFMARDEKELSRLLITSPFAKEGKTFVSVNISISIAHTGKKVLLVDADMRKPRVHKAFKIQYDRQKGLSSIIMGKATLEESVIETKYSNLYILPSGPIPPNPAELLQHPEFFNFLSRAEELFDLVIFDTPPVMVVSDAVVLASFTDGAILVCTSGSTPWTALKTVARRIESVNGIVLGAVLNKFSHKQQGSYYYKYGGYYSYRYTDYSSSGN